MTPANPSSLERSAGCLLIDPPARTSRYSTKRYEAVRVTNTSPDPRRPKWRTSEPSPVVAATLEQAVNEALANPAPGRHFFHKDRLVIRETDDGKQMLHVYAIRQGKPTYVHIDHRPQRVCDLHPDHICSIDLSVIEATGRGRSITPTSELAGLAPFASAQPLPQSEAIMRGEG